MNHLEFLQEETKLGRDFTPDFLVLTQTNPMAKAVYMTLIHGYPPFQMIEELVVRLNEVQEDYQNLMLKTMESK